MKRSLLFFLFICSALQGVHAQQSSVTAGGNDIGSGGTSSWTIGQPVYTSVQSGQGNVNQGVQQPYEFFPVGIFSQKKFSLECTVYPNPTLSVVCLDFNGNTDVDLFYDVYDLNGKKLMNGQINSSRTSVDLSSLSQGTYMLCIMNRDQKQSTFRIVKN